MVVTTIALLSQLFGSVQNGADLVEHYYFLAFHTTRSAEKELKNVPFCQNPQNWKTTNKNAFLKTLDKDISHGIKIAHDGTPDYTEQTKFKNAQMKKISTSLGSSKLSVCEYFDVPAYSDGHTWRFVAVNGKLAFLYEVGQPD